MRIRTATTCVLAAAVATWGGLAWAQDTMTPGQSSPMNPPMTPPAGGAMPAGMTPALPAGVTPKALDDKEDILEVVAAAANAAVTKDGLDDLVERFNDPDRNRLGQNDALDNDEWQRSLNTQIDAIKASWKAKYNDELELDDDEDETYADATVMQGEVQDAAAVMRGWPLAATMKKTDGAGGGMPTTRTSEANPSVVESPDERANLENGREVAVVALPGKMEVPALTLSMVGEIQGWKLDVPNTLTAQKLYQNVSDHLAAFNGMSAQWPADEKSARAMLTRHVMMAVYDVPMSGAAMPPR